MDHSWLTNRLLRRLVVVQVIIAVGAIIVTIVAGRQMSALIQTRGNLSRQVELLRRQIADQQSSIQTLQAQRAKAEGERAAIVQQLVKSRYAADHARNGINHYQRGEYVAAIEQYQEALLITPDNSEIYDWLAYSQYRAGRYLDALHSEQEAVRLEPLYARGYYNLALILWRTGKRDDAIAALRHMASLNPKMVEEVRQDEQFAPFFAMPQFRQLIGSRN